MTLFTFGTASRESLPPNDEKAGDFFARLGYGLSDAVADLVDNSIDAAAANVHIRFVRSGQGIHSVVIADDGKGMSDNELKEAMRFGSRSTKNGTQLGKYGIGLKSASLSQADRVTVLTRKGKYAGGRRWDLANVKNNWTCEVLRESDVREALNSSFGDVALSRSGTVVIWERLEHLQALPDHVDRVLTRTTKELLIELGIRFHRFIESNRVSIGLDQQFDLEPPSGIVTYVTALNPFAYEGSPSRNYPLPLEVIISGAVLQLECHIWPPRSRADGYKLGGGKVALRQGFYFYRNDRVIQAGGWNRLRADDSEPHLSLARVKVELPAALDSLFKLDVTKSRLDPAPEFARALYEAMSKAGGSFESYLADAQSVYRKQKKKDSARFPFVPGAGISAQARKAITTILKESGTNRPSQVPFRWERLDHDEMFRVDLNEPSILLNSKYKKELSAGARNEAPITKLLLMFLLQDELGKSYLTAVSTERIQLINQSLIAALKA